MTRWLLTVVANACGLAVAASLLDGIALTGRDLGDRLLVLAGVALLLTLVNAVVRPVVAFLSLPLYLLTLGLMFFVVNALMLLLTGEIAEALDLGFTLEGFGTALLGALLVTVVGWVTRIALPDPERARRR